MKKIFLIMMFFVLATGFTLGTGFQGVMAAEEDKYGGTLKVISSLRTPSKFGDPLKAIMVNFGYANTFYESLVAEGPPGKGIQPELAESWELSPDKKSYTFHLRKGVKFHDGTDFNAQAVKYNFDRVLKVKVPVPRRTRSHPLQTVGSPRIASNLFAEEHAADEIGREDDLNRDHADGADGHELVHWQQIPKRLIVVGVGESPGKTDDAKNMHGEEGAIEE